MVAELNNTFGERLPEVLRGPGPRVRAGEAPARLAVLRARPELRVGVLRAGGFGLGAHPRARGGGAAVHRRSPCPAPRAYECECCPDTGAVSVDAAAGDGADPPPGASALAEARAVPPQAGVHPRAGLGARMSVTVRTVRRAPRARVPLVDRVAVAFLLRELEHLEGGALDVTLPDGTRRSFGSGPAVQLRIHDARFFRRLATGGKLGLGESYTAGEWDCSDLVGVVRAPAPQRGGCFAASPCAAAGARGPSEAEPPQRLCCARGATSPTTTTSATSCSS